jgi:hypothetical protein
MFWKTLYEWALAGKAKGAHNQQRQTDPHPSLFQPWKNIRGELPKSKKTL